MISPYGRGALKFELMPIPLGQLDVGDSETLPIPRAIWQGGGHILWPGLRRVWRTVDVTAKMHSGHRSLLSAVSRWPWAVGGQPSAQGLLSLREL